MNTTREQFLDSCPLWLAVETIPYILIEGFNEQFNEPEDLKAAMIQEADTRRNDTTDPEDTRHSWALLWTETANNNRALTILFKYQMAFHYCWVYSNHNPELPSEWDTICESIHTNILNTLPGA